LDGDPARDPAHRRDVFELRLHGAVRERDPLPLAVAVLEEPPREARALLVVELARETDRLPDALPHARVVLPDERLRATERGPRERAPLGVAELGREDAGLVARGRSVLLEGERERFEARRVAARSAWTATPTTMTARRPATRPGRALAAASFVAPFASPAAASAARSSATDA